MAVKIAFVNNKGGSAKTTTLVNVAGVIHNIKPRAKILLVDGDAQGNVARSFGKSINPDSTIYNVFLGQSRPIDVVVKAHNKIDMITANQAMNYLEYDMMNQFNDIQIQDMFMFFKGLSFQTDILNNISLETFRKRVPEELNITRKYFDMLHGKFDEIDEDYDYILFDTPPELKAVTSSILAISDFAVIPYEPDAYSQDGIINIIQRIYNIKENINPKLMIAGVLPVKVKLNTKVHNAIIDSVKTYCNKNGINHLETVIPNSVQYSQAIAVSGTPLTLSTPKIKQSIIYANATDELLKFIRKAGK